MNENYQKWKGESNYIKSHIIEATRQLAMNDTPENAIRRIATEFSLNQEQKEKLRRIIRSEERPKRR